LSNFSGKVLNEVSGRYVELSDDFYIPDVFRKQSKVNKQGSEGEIDVLNDGTNVRQYFIDSCQHSYNMYKTLTDSGVAKEIARDGHKTINPDASV
jgi:thymidylate synthase (FAD)